jgi:hypothetical protein
MRDSEGGNSSNNVWVDMWTQKMTSKKNANVAAFV